MLRIYLVRHHVHELLYLVVGQQDVPGVVVQGLGVPPGRLLAAPLISPSMRRTVSCVSLSSSSPGTQLPVSGDCTPAFWGNILK